MKEIYILHEYYDPSHFKALIDECSNFGYEITEYIILSKINIIKKLVKDKIIRKQKINIIRDYISYCNRINSIKRKENCILIVGIAPYNSLLRTYADLFKMNKAIYFTSWSYWDNPRQQVHGGISRNEFLSIIDNNFKGIACVSKATQKTIESVLINNIKTSVVRHSIDIDNYKKKIINEQEYSNPKKFIMLGQLNMRKNTHKVIEWITKSNLNFEFYFAGSGEFEKDIINLADKDSRVTYLGYLSKDEIKATLKDYDFLVLLSQEEPYGIVLIEALAAGIPCIVSNAIGPTEIIENTKTGFIIQDSVNFESINEVFTYAIDMSFEEYYYMSQNALQEAKLYSTQNIVLQWMDLIN